MRADLNNVVQATSGGVGGAWVAVPDQLGKRWGFDYPLLCTVRCMRPDWLGSMVGPGLCARRTGLPSALCAMRYPGLGAEQCALLRERSTLGGERER